MFTSVKIIYEDKVKSINPEKYKHATLISNVPIYSTFPEEDSRTAGYTTTKNQKL